jgi:hypothetical protein
MSIQKVCADDQVHEEKNVVLQASESFARNNREWRRRFPCHTYLRIISAQQASELYNRLASHIAWAWSYDEERYSIVWIGKACQALITTGPIYDTNMLFVEFEDFIKFYGFQLTEDEEHAGYFVFAKKRDFTRMHTQAIDSKGISVWHGNE